MHRTRRATGFFPDILSRFPIAGWLVCLLLGLLPARIALAKTLVIDADGQYAYARHLFQEGQFKEAAHEFDRFAFFFPNDRRVSEARFQVGRCFFNLERFQAAEAAFVKLLASLPPGPLATRAGFMIVDCRVRQNNPGGAIRMLRHLIQHATEQRERDEAWRRLGWVLVNATRWHEAHRAFETISPEGKRRFSLAPVLSELERAGEIHQKRPVLAGLLSVLPGAGDLYCGRPHDAAIAFVLNTLLIGSTWEAFDRNLAWLGSLLAITETGIYSGTIYSAVSSTYKYNRDQKRAFIRRLHRLAPTALSLGPIPGGFEISCNLAF